MIKKQATQVAPWFAILATTLGGLALGQARRTPVIPQEPIPAIVAAFKDHDVVTLGDGPHGNKRGYAFRLALVRDHRFSNVVDDIVVEFGTARYQGIMDAFIVAINVLEGPPTRA